MTRTPRPALPLARRARIDALADLLDRAPTPPQPPVPGLARRWPEPARADVVLRDYVLAPYPPLAPVAGRLAAVNLLVESFAVAGVEAAGVALVEHLRAVVGLGRLVWGVKHAGGALAWEFYIYDPGRERAEVTPEAVAPTLAPWLAPPPTPRAPVPWHMWSLEVDVAALRDHGAARMTVYLGGGDAPGASRSYAVEPDGALTLGNLYTFHDPRREPAQLLARLATSAHLGSPARGVAAVIEPGLHRCRRLCVANKRRADGLYFAGIDTDGCARFLARHRWPAPLIGFVDGRRDAFRHLAWDLGLDFCASAGAGDPSIDKSAVYATA
ncbi:MAG: hypothetical protein R3B06_05785 [Kofleriaceae bacterium]